MRARLAPPFAIAMLALAAGLTAPPAAGDPLRDYRLHCQGCHLVDGRGMPGKVPSLAGEVAKFLSVPGGREFLIRVPGVANSRLSDAETAQLMNWMLRAFDPDHAPADFVPYTAEEVAPLRDDPLREVREHRRRLIKAMENSKLGDAREHCDSAQH